MDVIYTLIPLMLIIGAVMLLVFIWSAKSGQFDDLEGEASRILLDEDVDDLDQKSIEHSIKKPPSQ
ncbi:cbb3-type cytochrome oxidase assembly protein CcoS [Pelagibaculum spongiae]|uniref:Cbb3-type cytochrome oxidase assembly protein CcoS n=1 Tax=Pelagibaculum spongiae TaxID=2080658 RepID=A0A2V1GZ53_9GAMM|nr:cbb3-type cytochrome oxidase assembly protein CcoS [Pelagibaculum spongiae]PVZ70667.1 cbb3-type cytochrome oxidase assembly protein CcoS [Pelagibaculum spongiae]